MDSLVGSVDPQAVLVVAAIVVTILSVMLLLRILKVGASLILAILAIVLGVQFLFGISPGQLWGEIGNLPQAVSQLVQGFDPNSFISLLSD